MSAFPQIQSDLTATNLNLHCDPRTVGPKGSALDVKSKAGKIAVEDDICNLTVANLTVTESTSGAGAGVTQILAGNNVSIGPASGTGVVTINATGGGGGGLPAGTAFGEYLYHDDPGATNSWLVGGDKVNIGTNAGINPVAGAVNQIAIGFEAGVGGPGATTGQNSHAIAIGSEAGGKEQDEESIAIGRNSGTLQGQKAIAIGSEAGQLQKQQAIAIGDDAGRHEQSESAIAIGTNAGDGVSFGNNSQQGPNCIAIGTKAGQDSQATSDGLAIAIGNAAGTKSQGGQSIAIGNTAGSSGQGGTVGLAIAIGNAAGNTSQRTTCIAIGNGAGETNQGGDTGAAIAIGNTAGNTDQANECIAIGNEAGQDK